MLGFFAWMRAVSGGAACIGGALIPWGCAGVCPAVVKPPLEVRVGQGEVSEGERSPSCSAQVEVRCRGQQLSVSCTRFAPVCRCFLEFQGNCKVDIEATVGGQTFERSVRVEGRGCVTETKTVCINGPCDDVEYDENQGEIDLTD